MTQKLNIIFFCPSLAFGGLEMQMVNKCLDARDSGYEAVLVTLRNSPIEKYAFNLNVPSKNLKLLFDYVDVYNANKLGSIMKEFNSDVCVVGHSRHLSIALMARNLKSKKTAIVFMQQLQSVIKKIDFFHNKVYNGLDAVIVPASYMKEQLLKNTVIDKNKIYVIPYGIDVVALNFKNFNKQSVRKKFDLPTDKIIIGMAARFDELKDQLTLVRAFKYAGIKNSLLVLAGDGNPDYRLKVINEVQELNISDKVKFMEFTFDFAALLNSLDIFVMPSRDETFSLALIQAMAAGLPVIGTNEGGTPDAIRHLVNGMLFEASNHEALANSLRLLTLNPELRNKLGIQAHMDANIYYNTAEQNPKFFSACFDASLRRINAPVEA
jgi:glycosyltransferase involved in cell wall biosynthesis